MQRFIDKVVLITGSAEGMGRAITLAFAREGAIVVATDINTKLLAKTAKEASELSGRPVDWFKMDVLFKGKAVFPFWRPLPSVISELQAATTAACD